MSPTELTILNEKILHIGDAQLTYYLLEDNQVYFSQKEFNSFIGLTTSTGKPVLYQDKNSIFFTHNGEADIAVPSKNVVTLCAGKIEEMIKGDNDVNLLFKCLSLLTILSEKGIDEMTAEIESEKSKTEVEPEKDVKFDDLLAGLMRVPPPKKDKK